MKYVLSALGLVALAALADLLLFAEEFGLWTYTLGALAGMVVALLGLVILISTTFLRSGQRLPRLRLGSGLLLTGAGTFILSWIIWFALNTPGA
ncbi:MAG: hypothetical protein FH749_11875 [Firmicutes bacterium]|nr:hypothetical protein [Bacillota bacterium]